MATMQERRSPTVPVARERQVVSVARHAHHDQADAAPGVEPAVDDEERWLATVHADGGEGGDEDGPALINHSSTAISPRLGRGRAGRPGPAGGGPPVGGWRGRGSGGAY